MLKYFSIAILVMAAAISIWFIKPVTVIQSNSNPISSASNAFDKANNVNDQHQPSQVLPDILKDSSLKGTLIDGLYPVDEDGNLLLSNSIKHRFEYFLSVMGEFSLDEIKTMVREDIELNLQDPARSQALQLFDDYLSYKQSLVALEQTLQAPESYEVHDIERMRYQLSQLRDKRREYFNQETVDAFFGFDEMYDEFMLSRLEIQASSQLTQDEKQAQIDSLEQSLPEEVRNMRDDTQRISQVFEKANQMRSSGATQAEIFELNSQEFGQEAAQRLQQLDYSRQAFQNKVDTYLNTKKAILDDATLSDIEKNEKLSEALSSFDESEQRRLKAYELMASEKAAINN